MAELARHEDMMLVSEFLQFTQTRPDEEKWELLDGVPVLNASAVRHHQRIITNLLRRLETLETLHNGFWEAIPGIGARVSDYSLPVPDVMIVPPGDGNAHYCDNMSVAFEVLSPSNKQRDMNWKRKAYASMASVNHYVILAADKTEVLQFSRATGWNEQRLSRASNRIEFIELQFGLSLGDIYRGLVF